MSTGPAAPPAALACERLDAGYGPLRVVREFTLECAAGEVVAVIGPNGCGKSTLLKRLAGLLPPMGGRVLLGGEDVSRLRPQDLVAHGLRYVPQSRDIFPSLRVRENLIVSGREDPGRVAEVLQIFPDLGPLMGRIAGRLSGGERKMLGVARALMEPALKVVLFDEPSAGLAQGMSSRLWPVIRRMAEAGAGVIVVEQQVDVALEVADRAYVMVAGECRLTGSAEEIRTGYDLADVFLGA